MLDVDVARGGMIAGGVTDRDAAGAVLGRDAVQCISVGDKGGRAARQVGGAGVHHADGHSLAAHDHDIAIVSLNGHVPVGEHEVFPVFCHADGDVAVAFRGHGHIHAAECDDVAVAVLGDGDRAGGVVTGASSPHIDGVAADFDGDVLAAEDGVDVAGAMRRDARELDVVRRVEGGVAVTAGVSVLIHFGSADANIANISRAGDINGDGGATGEGDVAALAMRMDIDGADVRDPVPAVFDDDAAGAGRDQRDVVAAVDGDGANAGRDGDSDVAGGPAVGLIEAEGDGAGAGAGAVPGADHAILVGDVGTDGDVFAADDGDVTRFGVHPDIAGWHLDDPFARRSRADVDAAGAVGYGIDVNAAQDGDGPIAVFGGQHVAAGCAEIARAADANPDIAAKVVVIGGPARIGVKVAGRKARLYRHIRAAEDVNGAAEMLVDVDSALRRGFATIIEVLAADANHARGIGVHGDVVAAVDCDGGVMLRPIGLAAVGGSVIALMVGDKDITLWRMETIRSTDLDGAYGVNMDGCAVELFGIVIPHGTGAAPNLNVPVIGISGDVAPRWIPSIVVFADADVDIAVVIGMDVDVNAAKDIGVGIAMLGDADITTGNLAVLRRAPAGVVIVRGDGGRMRTDHDIAIAGGHDGDVLPANDVDTVIELPVRRAAVGDMLMGDCHVSPESSADVIGIFALRDDINGLQLVAACKAFEAFAAGVRRVDVGGVEVDVIAAQQGC